jgi:hypothetical protein
LPPFIGAGGRHGEAATGWQWLAFKGINAIDGRGFKEWFKRGNQGEGVKGRGSISRFRAWWRGGSQKRCEEAAARAAQGARV